MLATVPSAVLAGVDGTPVSVEVHVSNGLPGFTVVGLPDAAVRESRDRVRAALLSSGRAWPLRRVTVNLAPSGLRKCGAGLDLPIAIGLLAAAGELAADAVAGRAFVGELGLDGSLRGVPGTVVLAEALRAHELVVADEAANEAALAGPGRVRCAPTLAALLDRLTGRRPWVEPRAARRAPPGRRCAEGAGVPEVDLAEIRGQRLARRALEVAAAGGHHLLLIGPPGSGKTMLATRLPGLLPPLTPQTALEATRIQSVAGFALPDDGLLCRPPFRAPHHGVSPVAMVGGGTPWMRPGEISLAHGGVLFLDEMGEFPAVVLDALRQPLEEGQVRVSRARGSATFPARFLLVGAMNPCPCGEGGPPGACRCSRTARERYARRLSAPLLDRFDLAIRVERPTVEQLLGNAAEEDSATVAARVAAARERARARGVEANAALAGSRLADAAPMAVAASELVATQVRAGALSARGLHRVHRLARTIADLEGLSGEVAEEHVREALLLRCRRHVLLGTEHG